MYHVLMYKDLPCSPRDSDFFCLSPFLPFFHFLSSCFVFSQGIAKLYCRIRGTEQRHQGGARESTGAVGIGKFFASVVRVFIIPFDILGAVRYIRNSNSHPGLPCDIAASLSVHR
ncbi:hypothetical protein J3F83DRAFT_392070 [Trichoderma novae-zelandiae]